MPKISQRAQKIVASPIRKFLPLVRQAEARGIKVLKLSAGDPDLAPPPSLLKRIKSYKQKNIAYAPSPGLPEHVDAWVKYYSRFGIKLNPNNLIPTVGGAEAILMALLAVTDAGDEIIIFEPFYSPYKGFASITGIKMVPVTLELKNNFGLPKASEIESKITKKTKAIVIITPNNPTGTVLTKKEIQTVIDLAIKHNLFVISDETYREIVFDRKPISLMQFAKIQQQLILVDSASKRFSCPGFRIGCLASYNDEVMAAVLKIAMTRLSAPTLEQYGLIDLLKDSGNYIPKITAEYQKRRDLVYRQLTKIPGVICQPTHGTFYLMAKLPVQNAEDFVKFLLNDFQHKKQTVLIVPAEDFYITKGLGRNEIRLALVLDIRQIKQAIEILGLALTEYQKKYE